MRKITLDPRDVPKANKQLQRLIQKETREAMVRLAQFGLAQTQKYTTRARPRPYATGAFANGWTWARTADGAILWNSARHGVFVELGRRPGRKPPPLQAILEWLEVKGLAKRIKPKRARRKKAKRPRSPSKPAARKPRAKGPRVKLTPEEKVYKRNEAKLTRWAAREAGKMARQKAALEAAAWAIAYKIARDGVKPRPVLAKAWPHIVKRSKRELRVGIGRAIRAVKV